MIDHLVLAAPDLDAAAAVLRADWGVDLVVGGAHDGLGTCNRLTGLGSGAYLEVIGPDPDQPSPAAPRPFGVDDLDRPRLVAWCARPSRSLDEVIEACAQAGAHLGPASPMSRTRPDGVRLAWRLTFPVVGAPLHGTIPFLIDWLGSPHPAATLPAPCTLSALTVRTAHPDRLRAVLAAVGHDERVDVVEGPAGLEATVDTPNGSRRLTG